MRRHLRPVLSIALTAAIALAATPAVACELDDIPTRHTHERTETCESGTHGSGSWHHGRGKHSGWSWKRSECNGGVTENPPVEETPTPEPSNSPEPSTSPAPSTAPEPAEPEAPAGTDEPAAPVETETPEAEAPETGAPSTQEPEAPAPETAEPVADEPSTDEPAADEPANSPTPAVETPVFTETVVSSTPLPTVQEDSLAETGPKTSLAIPCIIASFAAGAGMLVARRRAMGL